MRFSEFHCATGGAEFAVSPEKPWKTTTDGRSVPGDLFVASTITVQRCVPGAATRTSRIRGGRLASRTLESDRLLKKATQKLLLLWYGGAETSAGRTHKVFCLPEPSNRLCTPENNCGKWL
jgi:hypothetical protein